MSFDQFSDFMVFPKQSDNFRLRHVASDTGDIRLGELRPAEEYHPEIANSPGKSGWRRGKIPLSAVQERVQRLRMDTEDSEDRGAADISYQGEPGRREEGTMFYGIYKVEGAGGVFTNIWKVLSKQRQARSSNLYHYSETIINWE